MSGYVVTFTQYVESANPSDASMAALAELRNPNTVATVADVQQVLTVAPSDGRPWTTENHGLFNALTGEAI